MLSRWLFERDYADRRFCSFGITEAIGLTGFISGLVGSDAIASIVTQP
jgi:hypothetical protein